MKLEIENNYNEGVRLDDSGHYIFDYEKDFESDIIKLTSGTGGQGTLNNEPFYYAYELNDNVKPNIQKAFRDALKHKMTDKHVFFSEQAFDFVECGIGRMYSMRSMDDFSLVISTATHYGEKTLAGLMCVYIWDTVKSTVETYDKFHLELFKKHCQEVTFDEERARKALMQTTRYGKDIRKVDDAIEHIKGLFEQAKIKNDLFTMKAYKPVIGRAGFIDFLKFKDDADQNVYRNLRAGKEVLICDDFLTSGATIEEIKRFLRTINPDVKLSVFVLVNQLRSY